MKLKLFKFALLSTALSTIGMSTSALAHNQARSDDHAPIDVMGDHLHKSGEWMVSYRYMHMDMADLMRGNDDISIDTVLENYMMAPQNMTMDMHMFGVMYAPSDDITLMFMTNYLDNTMSSTMRMPMKHNNMHHDMHNMDHGMANKHSSMTMQTDMQNNGFGDSRLGILIRGNTGENYRTHFTLGLSLPTGDIDMTHTNSMGKEVVSGYPMQLGTGTYNMFGAFTYVYQNQDWQYGFQANYEAALDDNNQDYKPGNKLLMHNWVSYSWVQNFSSSLRVSYKDKDNYSGRDARLNPVMMPTADPKQRGGSTVDIALGANYLFTDGALAGQRLAVEIAKPVLEDFDGIQMKTGYSATLGWQMAF